MNPARANGLTDGLRDALARIPDVVVCDLELADGDGMAVARALRQLRSFDQTAIVALSGHAQDEMKRSAVEAGFDCYLVKPCDPLDIQKALADAVEKRRREMAPTN